MQAIMIKENGGPEKLVLAELDSPVPGPGQVRVDVSAAGVNFIDVYHRTGHYPNALPITPGVEGAGVVSAVGDGVTAVSVGDRVGWVNHLGGYAQQAVIPAEAAIPLPGRVDDQTAAASLLQGMTAHYLVFDSYRVRAGDTVLVHAGAGGMGLLLTQLIKHLGGRVITTASSPEKAELSRAAGADLVLTYAEVPDAVRRDTGGTGVAAVYDGVGRDTFEASLASLRPRGTMVSFGSASGPVPPVEPLALTRAGSVSFTRPSLAHFIADRSELLARAGDVLTWVADGVMSITVGNRYPLADASVAHAALEGRRSTGKLLLIP